MLIMNFSKSSGKLLLCILFLFSLKINLSEASLIEWSYNTTVNWTNVRYQNENSELLNTAFDEILPDGTPLTYSLIFDTGSVSSSNVNENSTSERHYQNYSIEVNKAKLKIQFGDFLVSSTSLSNFTLGISEYISQRPNQSFHASSAWVSNTATSYQGVAQEGTSEGPTGAQFSFMSQPFGRFASSPEDALNFEPQEILNSFRYPDLDFGLYYNEISYVISAAPGVFTIASVPEPSPLLLFTLGLLGIGFIRMNQKHQ